jgi:hypothetical protein
VYEDNVIYYIEVCTYLMKSSIILDFNPRYIAGTIYFFKLVYIKVYKLYLSIKYFYFIVYNCY